MQIRVFLQGAWPWLTLVKVITSEDDTEADVLCAGSLVCPGWVLTSARCLESTDHDGTIVPLVAGNVSFTVQIMVFLRRAPTPIYFWREVLHLWRISFRISVNSHRWRVQSNCQRRI